MAEVHLITSHLWLEIAATYALPVAFVGAIISIGGREMLANLFAAKWLGHGRATECYLAAVATLYGLSLLIPNAAYTSRATVDIAQEFGSLLALPLLAKAALTSAGLIFNINGLRWSRELRFAGAALGTLIWLWLAAKFFLIGAFTTVGMPFCIVSTLFSVRIMAMALADLPPPAALGRIQ